MRTINLLGTLPALLFGLACSTLDTAPGASDGSLRAEGPGTTFPTLEEAAMDALVYAHLDGRRGRSAGLMAGTVYRIDGGFSYSAPERSFVDSRTGQLTVRYPLSDDAAAHYFVHEKQDVYRLDRLAEEPTAYEKRVVDEIDPGKRPLFLLTPSLNVVVYAADGPTEFVAKLRDAKRVGRLLAAQGLATPLAR